MPDFGNPRAPIDYGFDYNFFAKLTVNNANYNTNCDMIINLAAPTYAVSFQLESGTRIEYSFNGITTHGDMILSEASTNLLFQNRVISKIWFRGDGYVRVEAWAIR
jgi:hypothetical protein